jgi:hypothetical protein
VVRRNEELISRVAAWKQFPLDQWFAKAQHKTPLQKELSKERTREDALPAMTTPLAHVGHNRINISDFL